MTRVLSLLVVLLGLACVPGLGIDAGPDSEPIFPADLSAFTEVRDCRHSHEHELRHIRVIADALAFQNYDIWDHPYAVGSLLVKLEYDDEGCRDEDLLGYTAMVKLEEGENPEGGDWWWQTVSPERRVVEQGAPSRCIACHTVHCAPPNGFDLTCAEEL
jgi:hypothetical protein